MSNKQIYLILTVVFLFSMLNAQINDLVENRVIKDVSISEFNSYDYGFSTAIPGANGGLGYLVETDSFEIFSIASNLGAVSIQPESDICYTAFGCGSNSDGLYKYDKNNQSFELIDWYVSPNFIEKLESGYYFGFINGLIYSESGQNWELVSFFNMKNVKDIIKFDDKIFVAAESKICMSTDDSFVSYETNLVVNDIHCLNDTIYIACGDGTDSDGIYRVNYNDNEITGITLINYFFYPNEIYHFSNQIVVGCLNNNGLFLTETEQFGEVTAITLPDFNFTDVYCFETYPIYCPNFIVGTDVGCYLYTGNTYNQIDEVTKRIELVNYPNPFNPSTTIDFSLPTASDVNLSIYNIKGQQIKTLANEQFESGNHSVMWHGKNKFGQSVGSGVYLYKVLVNNQIYQIKKMTLLK